MFIRNWKKELYTVPNLLSLIRLGMIPFYCSIYLRASIPSHYLFAGMILTVSCLTDLADGQIARRFDSITTLGKILDPLADKATQLTLAACLTLRHLSLLPVLIMLIVKESFQLAAGILALRRGKILSGALAAGKICTTVLFVSFILMIIFPKMDDHIRAVLAGIDLFFLIVSFGCYASAYCGQGSKMQDIPKD